METGYLLLSTCCLSGGIYLLIGYLLSFKQKADVLNGIDFSKINDLPAFCKFVGNSFLLSGALQIVAGVFVYFAFVGLLLFVAIYVFFSVMPIINIVRAMRK